MPYTFKYKKSSFFINDPKKELNFDDYGWFQSYLLGKSPIMELRKEFAEMLIAIDHELIHYVQDLMINACISEGFLTDYITGLLSRVSGIKGIKIPLPFQDDQEYKKIISALNSPEEIKILEDLYLLVKLYNELFIINYEDENLEKYGPNLLKEESEKYHLSFKDLIESYAYHKAYWDFFCINRSPHRGCEMLHSLSLEYDLYPYSYDQGIFECNDFRRKIYWRKSYMLPYYLILKSFPIKTILQDYVNYCNHDIPRRYYRSPAKWMHNLFLLIMDTALGIPGIDYIINETKEGADIKIFSPAYRFFKILDTINKNPQFLYESVESANYRLFFNYIASANNWLNYEKTVVSMHESINRRAENNGSVIINYIKKVWERRYKGSDDLINMRPAELIEKYCLPVIIQQKAKIGITFHNDYGSWDKSFYDKESDDLEKVKWDILRPNDNFYSVFLKSSQKRYQIVRRIDNRTVRTNKNDDNSSEAIREILIRLFSADAREAMTLKHEYHCPLAKGGCPNICMNCSSFKSFKDATLNCMNKIEIKDQGWVYYDNEEGDVPDCMYLVYLLLYGFININFN
jgi:hypothetical protein